MPKFRSIDTLTLDSSVLCCNFVNTVYAWRGKNLHEYLGSYADFIAWCRKLHTGDENQLIALQMEAATHPQKAEAALSRIKEIRALLYSLISAIAAHEQTKYDELLAQVNPLIADALAHIALSPGNNDFKIGFREAPVNLLSPLWAILKSLYELLTQQPADRIKECPKCGWVFYDETKNGRRRWCNPAECGTQDKMNRYNKKKKSVK